MSHRRSCGQYLDSSRGRCFVKKEKKEGKSQSASDLVTNLSSTKRPCMHSFLMLSGWYNESGHKSRALSNCLTCFNNTEPWQGKLVLNVPPLPSLSCYKLLHCLPGGHVWGCYNPSTLPSSTSLWEKFNFALLLKATFELVKFSKLALLFAAKTGRDLGSGQEFNEQLQ